MELNGNMPGVTRYVLQELTVPIVFSGFELGVQIKTGAAFNRLDPGHPLYIGYRHFSEHAPWMKQHYRGKILDNASYDQTAVGGHLAGQDRRLVEESRPGHRRLGV
jgi:hypothetical protein